MAFTTFRHHGRDHLRLAVAEFVLEEMDDLLMLGRAAMCAERKRRRTAVSFCTSWRWHSTRACSYCSSSSASRRSRW